MARLRKHPIPSSGPADVRCPDCNHPMVYVGKLWLCITDNCPNKAQGSRTQ